MGEHLERLGKVDDPEPLKQSGGRDGGVEIESRGEGSAEREAEGSSGDMPESYYSSQSIVTPPTAVVTSISRWRVAWS